MRSRRALTQSKHVGPRGDQHDMLLTILSACHTDYYYCNLLLQEYVDRYSTSNSTPIHRHISRYTAASRTDWELMSGLYSLQITISKCYTVGRSPQQRHLIATHAHDPLKRRRICIETARERLRIPPTSRLSLLARLPNLRRLLPSKHNLQRSSVLSDPLNRRRPWDREKVVALRKDPGERQLAGSAVPFLRKLGDEVDEHQVLGEVLGREPRRIATHVGGVQVVWAPDLAAEHAAADRRVGDDGDAEFSGGLKEADLLRFNVQAERRVSGGKLVSWEYCCVLQTGKRTRSEQH
jgi:hypothetical protein